MSEFSAADPIVILSYARTPMGGMQGVFSDVSATDLGATAVKAAAQHWLAGAKHAYDVEALPEGAKAP